MLGLAPIVMVRGNHEACNNFSHSHYGFGLFFGLGETAYDCTEGDLTQPTFALDVARGLRLVVADTSYVRAFAPKLTLTARCDVKPVPESDRKSCANV